MHFFSYPYTSERAKEKVLELARLLTKYCGRMTVDIVGFTEIQEAIRDHCREEYFTIIMRRFMMRLAEKVGTEHGTKCLVTGENLGQVASQTMDAMLVQAISGIGGRANSTKLILAGIAVSAVAAAFSDTIVYFCQDKQGIQSLTFWSM